MQTELEAVNGKKMQALEVFAHALRFFKQHAVQVRAPRHPSQLSPHHHTALLSLPKSYTSSSPCVASWPFTKSLDAPAGGGHLLLLAHQELKDQCPSLPERDAIRWVITVPAIWKQPAKQFMREAAYKVRRLPG